MWLSKTVTWYWKYAITISRGTEMLKYSAYNTLEIIDLLMQYSGPQLVVLQISQLTRSKTVAWYWKYTITISGGNEMHKFSAYNTLEMIDLLI